MKINVITSAAFVDENGNMIGYMRYKNGKEIEKPAEPFHAKLKVIDFRLLNSGFYFVLEDENGKTYSMNDVLFDKYLKKNAIYFEGNWNFYQQGTAFSIGL